MARSRNFYAEFGTTFKWEIHGNEAVCRIANEFEKIRFCVVVHDVAPNTNLRSDDLDKFARERRFLGNWPAVNQNKINRAAKIAKSYARVSLSNINVARKSSVRQIAFRSRDFRRHEFRANYCATAIVMHGCRKIES